jgi:hypothetical protein
VAEDLKVALIVEAIDKASAELKKVEKELDVVGKAGARAGEQASKGASKVGSGFKTASEGIHIVTQMLSGGLVTQGRAFSEVLLDTEHNWKGVTIAAGVAATAMVGAFAFYEIGERALDLIKDTAHEMTELKHLAEQTGTSTEFLSSIGYAAQTAGAQVEDMKQAMRFLNKAIGDAAGDSKGPAREAFHAIGIELSDLKNLNSEQIFFKVADAMAGARDNADKFKVAMALFSRSYQTLLPLLNEGSVGIQEQFQKAAESGNVVSEKMASGAKRINDAFVGVKLAAEGVSKEMVNQVSKGGMLEAFLGRLQQRLTELRQHWAAPPDPTVIDDIHKAGEDLAKSLGMTTEEVRKMNLETRAANPVLREMLGMVSANDQAFGGLTDSILKGAGALASFVRQAQMMATIKIDSLNTWVDNTLSPASVDKATEFLHRINEKYKAELHVQTEDEKRAIAEQEAARKKADSEALSAAKKNEEERKRIVDELDKHTLDGIERLKQAELEKAKALGLSDAQLEQYRETLDEKYLQDEIRVISQVKTARENANKLEMAQLEAIGTAQAGAQAALLEFQQKAGDTFNQTKTAVTQFLDQVGPDFAGLFKDLITGAKDSKQAFSDFLLKVTDQIIDLGIQLLVVRPLMSSIFGGLGGAGGIGGMALGGLGGGGGITSLLGGLFHAKGGVVDRPSIAGEAGPEGIVPLPDGRSIPVILANKSSRNNSGDVHFNASFLIQANDTDGFDALLAKRKPLFVNMFREALQRDHGTRIAARDASKG